MQTTNNNTLDPTHSFINLNYFVNLSNNHDDQEDLDGLDLLFGEGCSDEQSASTYSTDSCQRLLLSPQEPQTPQSLMAMYPSNVMLSSGEWPSLLKPCTFPSEVDQSLNSLDSGVFLMPPNTPQFQMSVSSGPLDATIPETFFYQLQQQTSTFLSTCQQLPSPCNSIVNNNQTLYHNNNGGKVWTPSEEEELKSYIESECKKIFDRHWSTLPPLRANSTKKRDKFDLEEEIKKKLKN
ncbi:hypothetical protein FDP41_006946 [Naegleria fowleri]|uniref:Uncharacterized protein n=1 Tax=Naegleria fowleri TaxID=5763 RepID=A0A6A5BK76_NAEFO|nr:uncharacterized protein FDP41_006946 [Naegleria fowleri]KAF0974015.1 hypothetical protein FDP41_006946 [Naegleria fowleri]CAG4718340.1 unnamed protein product [Naegleria fowleri]